YALTEGAGLFGSADKGNTWLPPLPPSPVAGGLGGSLQMDPKMPKRLFAGRQKFPVFPTPPGGAFVPFNSGQAFHPIGLPGVTVAGLAINGSSTRLFAATYGSGIYVSPIPANLVAP